MFKKNHIPWNKGLHIRLSPKSEFKKGSQIGKEFQFQKGHMPWIKGKNAVWAEKFGKDNPNWKGGISTEEKSIKNSKEWKKWRKQVFERDNYTCQKCGQRGGRLHPHHIKSFAENIDLRFELNNGQTLCSKCHKKTDNYGANGYRLAKKHSVKSGNAQNG